MKKQYMYELPTLSDVIDAMLYIDPPDPIPVILSVTRDKHSVTCLGVVLYDSAEEEAHRESGGWYRGDLSGRFKSHVRELIETLVKEEI